MFLGDARSAEPAGLTAIAAGSLLPSRASYLARRSILLPWGIFRISCTLIPSVSRPLRRGTSGVADRPYRRFRTRQGRLRRPLWQLLGPSRPISTRSGSFRSSLSPIRPSRTPSRPGRTAIRLRAVAHWMTLLRGAARRRHRSSRGARCLAGSAGRVRRPVPWPPKAYTAALWVAARTTSAARRPPACSLAKSTSRTDLVR